MPLPDCCDEIIGGEVYITAKFSSGQNQAPMRFEGMGEIRLQPSRVTRASGASTGGTIWVTETARAPKILMSFINRCEHDPMLLFMQRCRVEITLVEKTRGFVHLMSDAHITGDPEKNLATGEITGIEIVSQTYKVSSDTPQDTVGNISPSIGGPPPPPAP